MSDAEPAAERHGDGERLHPLGLVVSFINGLPELFLPLLAIYWTSRGSGMASLFGVVGFLILSLIFRWVFWLIFRYHLGMDSIRIERGILNRTVRSISFSRIQNVSIEQNLVARLLGLCEVTLDTGSGKGDEAKLSYVTIARAEALRETIRLGAPNDVKQAERAMPTEAAPVFILSNARLLLLGAYSFSFLALITLPGFLAQFDWLLPFDFWNFETWSEISDAWSERLLDFAGGSWAAVVALALALILGIGLAGGIIFTVLQDYGFRLERTDRGFRRRRGLLTKTDAAIVLKRVQAVCIFTGPVRKSSGWFGLRFISLGQGQKHERDYLVLPLAKLSEVLPIVAETGIRLPDAGAHYRKPVFSWWACHYAAFSIAATLIATLACIAFQVSLSATFWVLLLPILSVPLAWLQWRKYYDLVEGATLTMRKGWWRQKQVVAPQLKVQSVDIRQNPISRLLGLSTVHFGIAGGALRFSALPVDQAYALRDHVLTVIAPVDFSKLEN